MLLSEYTSNRDNNFNLLRFVAAFIVLYTHSFSLKSGIIADEPMRLILEMSLGDIAVDVFFITSGFLITSSYINRGDVIAFAWARILRIFPALIVAMVFCVFVIGLYFTNLNGLDYLMNPDIYQYLVKNITLFFGVTYDLPGVFQGVPYASPVNGSIWTLPYEVKMYVVLAFILTIVVCLRKKMHILTFKNVLLFVGVFSFIILIVNHFYTLREGSVFVEKFIRLFTAFFMGAMFYVWKEHIILSYKWFFVLLGSVLLSSIHQDIYFIIYYLTLPYILFFIAYVPAGNIRKFNNYGDYSYGLYIYAFPIQQGLLVVYPEISIVSMIVFSFLITFILAILSWHLIEKRALKLKNNYQFIKIFILKIGLESKCTDKK